MVTTDVAYTYVHMYAFSKKIVNKRKYLATLRKGLKYFSVSF